MQLSKFQDYIDSKKINIDDLSKEECFRACQIQTIVDFATSLGMSLTYNGLEWVEEIAQILKDRKLNDDESFDYKKLFETKSYDLKMPYFLDKNGNEIKI